MNDKAAKKPDALSSDDIPLFIVGGPAGCGKSTIAGAIATHFHFSFIEGDKLHPPHNIAKMSSGTPLVDADRWEWLDTIISTSQREESQHSRLEGIVITCSSLKRSYRDRMRERVEEGRRTGQSRLRAWFVFCNLSQMESLRRVEARPGHFMKAEMVASQFEDLEMPDPMGEPRVYLLDVEKSIPEVQKDAVDYVSSCLEGMKNRGRDER
jgi:gluconokinase